MLVLSGLVQAVYGGLMHLSGANLEIFGAQVPHAAHASGGFVNRNHLAGFLEITLALGIGLMIGALQETGPRSWRQFLARHGGAAAQPQGAAAHFPGGDGDRAGDDALAHGQHRVLRRAC